MVIVVAGMVGLDKKQYLQEVCSYAKEQGTDILLCSVGDMMYAEAPDIPPGRILDISREREGLSNSFTLKWSANTLYERPYRPRNGRAFRF